MQIINKGESKKALHKVRAMCGMAETMEGYLGKVFKGWKVALVFRGQHNPLQHQRMMNFKPVAGWSDFNLMGGK